MKTDNYTPTSVNLEIGAPAGAGLLALRSRLALEIRSGIPFSSRVSTIAAARNWVVNATLRDGTVVTDYQITVAKTKAKAYRDVDKFITDWLGADFAQPDPLVTRRNADR